MSITKVKVKYIIEFEVFQRKPYTVRKKFNTYSKAIKWLENNVMYWCPTMIKTVKH